MKSAVACAIYTRKSSEEGLEQDFNSLDAQREACEAFVLSQKHEGWKALPAVYDDGGFSGGTIERPALKRLLADIAARKIQVVVVYKVDRLTRSLADFAKIVELFDSHGVSFVSVTQQFNTTSSMGRLTLNVLLSFAQFEREVTGERIRDKIAASKKKGMWMGGNPPIGYIPHDRTLVIDPAQAERVQEIFRLYLELRNVRTLKAEIDRRGWRTPARVTRRKGAGGEAEFTRGHLYRILSNPVYIGQIQHKETCYPGKHPPIIEQALWDNVQSALESNRQGTRDRVNAKEPSLLAGLVFDADGEPLTPTHATKGSRRYRYYVSKSLIGQLKEAYPKGLRIPAQELEGAVRQAIIGYLNDADKLITDVEPTDASSIRDLLQRRTRLADRVAKGTTRQRIQLYGRLVARVIVDSEKLAIQLSRAELRDCQDEHLAPIEIRYPVQFRRCGLGLRLIVHVPGPRQQKSIDERLVRLLNLADAWFGGIVNGKRASDSAIALSEGWTKSYITRVTYLAFLAPDIKESIRQGTHPVTITADQLMRHVPLPIRWDEQRAILGIAQ